jgi:hypothetical protein
MALPTTSLPYGLREVKLYPLDASDVFQTGVKLPISQTFSFSEAEDFQELRGDDKLQATRGKGPKVEWSLESGGISLAAYTVLAGGTLTTTGTTPNQIKKLNKKDTDVRPYFGVEGRALSDSGGDFHGKVYKARADASLEGEMKDGEFWVSSASGSGIGNVNGDLYDFIQNETATAIV